VYFPQVIFSAVDRLADHRGEIVRLCLAGSYKKVGTWNGYIF